jgi:hypothetical protein
MAWYAYCIGEKQAFPELARHRKPVPMESVLGVSGNQVFPLSRQRPRRHRQRTQPRGTPEPEIRRGPCPGHRRLLPASTVLPFRFGTIFNDDESLRKSIRSNQRQFLGNIDKLRGKTEMHLKILVDDCCGRESRSICRPKGGPGVSDQPARECLQHARAPDARPRRQLPDAPALPASGRRGELPAHRKRQDGAGHRPPDRPQMRGALPEQVRHHQRHDARVPDAALRPLAALSLRTPLTRPGHPQPAAASSAPAAAPIEPQSALIPEPLPAMA